jgi:hypothetical protein
MEKLQGNLAVHHRRKFMECAYVATARAKTAIPYFFIGM